MILSARDLQVKGCTLHIAICARSRFFHGRRGECGIPTAPGLPLSVTLTAANTGVCDDVDFASPSIKRNLNICQGTIDDAVGLFQNMTKCNINHT